VGNGVTLDEKDDPSFMDSMDHSAALSPDGFLAPPQTTTLSGEIKRKAYHIMAGTPAFALRVVSPVTMVIVFLCLLLWNTFIWRVLPDSYRAMWRPNEHTKGVPTGILVYCIAVIALLLTFSSHKWMAAAVWGVMAFGDGMAGLVGRFAGGPRLPWNGSKGWYGSLAFVLFGTLGAAALIAWILRVSFAGVLPIAAALSLACALVESIPWRFDDNVTVPLTGAIALPLLLMVPALAI
jgi:dolichol kinase